MLGKIPLVSISESRLGGIENSSLVFLSATRALEFSTSRMVRPSFSRSVRRLFPAGSIVCLQRNVEESYQRRDRLGRQFAQKSSRARLLRIPNTRSALSGAQERGPSVSYRAYRAPALATCVSGDCSEFVTSAAR